MKKRIAINGFGRIGRTTLRALLKKDECTIVAINDLAAPNVLAHLFEYDTNHGKFVGEIHADDTSITINGHTIQVSAQRDPSILPWKALNIDTVLESTGFFTSNTQAAMHLNAGAKKVIVSAPGKGDMPTIVVGVNCDTLQGDEKIISNASCTTNCIAPMLKVIEAHFGISKGYINTIHAYTTDQCIQDAPHKDLRRARSAFQSIIPTSTGAAKAIGKVIPSLQGKLDGIAMRVPVANGSVTDCTLLLEKITTKEIINEKMYQESQNDLKNILAYTTDPVVSVDIIGNTHSCIFDASLTAVHGNLVKIVGWYDNEKGYAYRIADLIKMA